MENKSYKRITRGFAKKGAIHDASPLSTLYKRAPHTLKHVGPILRQAEQTRF